MKWRERMASPTEAPCGAWRCARLRVDRRQEQAAVARIVLDQQSEPSAHDGGNRAKREIGATPSKTLDQKRGQRWHGQRADTNSADGETGSEAAAPHEPALHGADGRDVGAADAEANAEPVGDIDLQQAARGACGHKADGHQDHAGDGEAAGAEAVGEGPADDAKAEVEETGKRKHQRHRAARRAEIPLQRIEEGAEGIGGAEADEGHGECGGDDEPAVEDAGEWAILSVRSWRSPS